jgi:hypothetical protein
MPEDKSDRRRKSPSAAPTVVEPLPEEEPTVRRGESAGEPRESQPDGPGWEEVTP